LTVPDYYVRSTDGNNADSGATWALAKADLQTPTWAAGDRIFVSQAHAQTTGATINIALNGTRAAPTQIICANDSAEPPTAVADTATVYTTGAFAISFTGSGYIYGIQFRAGSGASNVTLTVGNSGDAFQIFENCLLENGSTGGSGFAVSFGFSSSALGSYAELINCDLKFNSAASSLRVVNGWAKWRGGALIGTTLTAKVVEFGVSGRGGIMEFDGVDLSNCGSSINLVEFDQGTNRAIFKNCKLPASWSGVLAANYYVGCQVEMYNCDSGDTNYRLWIENFAGSTKSETVVVRTGGASDGTTALSWRMATNADAEYPAVVLHAPEIVVWNDVTGSAITVTLEVITDNVTLTDAEAWIEVQYLGTSGFPLGVFVTDAKADVLATAANQTTSTESWTTTGLTTPVKQKLSVTFTPQEKGFVHIVPCLAKAGTTMYVCPKAELS